MATCSYKRVEYKFVNTPQVFLDELKCPICLELVTEPVQTSCGHLFCKNCIRGVESCPVDRAQFTTTPDHFNERRLRRFKVKCTNSEKGCGWEGDLGDAEKHTEDLCPFTICKCHNSGCNKRMERRLIDEHMRTMCSHRWRSCTHCNEEYLKVNEAGHTTICEAFPLPCPARCLTDLQIPRRALNSHLSIACPNELVPCAYATAGCQKAIKRQDMHIHLQDKDHHLAAVITSHITLVNTVQHLVKMHTGSQQAEKNPPAAFSPPLAFCPWLQNEPTCYPRPPWVVKMKRFQEKNEKEQGWWSVPVYSHFGGYKMCVYVDASGDQYAKGTHVSLFFFLMKGDNDGNLKWPFKGTIKVSLLNSQLNSTLNSTQLYWRMGNTTPGTYCHLKTLSLTTSTFASSQEKKHTMVGE